MNTFEIAIAIFVLVLLASAVTGTKETAGPACSLSSSASSR